MKQLLLSFFALLNYAAQAQGLQYSIEPVFDRDNLRLRVTVTFDGEADGETFFGFENEQFGVPDQMNFLDISQQKDGITAQKEPDSNRIVVKHPRGKKTQFVYEVLDLQGNQAFYSYCCYKPILKSDYFHLQSGHLLLAPSEYWQDKNQVKTIQFNWLKFPVNWTLHNSFGLDAKQIVDLSNSQFTSAIFVGGDFRRYSFEVEKQPVYFLTRGKWLNFPEDTLVSVLKSIVKGHRDFWNDHTDTLFSVTFLPVEGASWSDTSKFLSYGGSGLTNSFLSFATNNKGLEISMIRYVYVHELMHRWIGGKIENANEEKQYWFSEGFTEYFTLKNSLRYGLIDVPEFLKSFNDDFLFEHHISPMKAMPNDSMNYRNFWSGNKDWEKLPYRRGCLYAFYLDNQLREKTNGEVNLDLLMREILVEVNTNPLQKLDHPFFMKFVRKYLGKRGKKDFNRYIVKGAPIDFEKTILPQGLECQKKDVKYSYGPSKDVITGTKEHKDVPSLLQKSGVDMAALKAAILK
jgi:predicted metalloprotease with PDZ domain